MSRKTRPKKSPSEERRDPPAPDDIIRIQRVEKQPKPLPALSTQDLTKLIL